MRWWRRKTKWLIRFISLRATFHWSDDLAVIEANGFVCVLVCLHVFSPTRWLNTSNYYWHLWIHGAACHWSHELYVEQQTDTQHRLYFHSWQNKKKSAVTINRANDETWKNVNSDKDLWIKKKEGWNEVFSSAIMQLFSVACNTELNKERTEMTWEKVGDGLMGEVDNRQEVGWWGRMASRNGVTRCGRRL